jgi:hypothetical protein
VDYCPYAAGAGNHNLILIENISVTPTGGKIEVEFTLKDGDAATLTAIEIFKVTKEVPVPDSTSFFLANTHVLGITTPGVGGQGMRDDFTGFLGHNFELTKKITLTALGRQYTNNTIDHDVVLWDYAAQTELARVTITPASPESGGFKYEMLATELSLKAGKKYTITVYEVTGSGDLWPETNPLSNACHTDVAIRGGPTYGNGSTTQFPTSSFYIDHVESYAAPNFWYKLPPPQPFVARHAADSVLFA